MDDGRRIDVTERAAEPPARNVRQAIHRVLRALVGEGIPVNAGEPTPLWWATVRLAIDRQLDRMHAAGVLRTAATIVVPPRRGAPAQINVECVRADGAIVLHVIQWDRERGDRLIVVSVSVAAMHESDGVAS